MVTTSWNLEFFRPRFAFQSCCPLATDIWDGHLSFLSSCSPVIRINIYLPMFFVIKKNEIICVEDMGHAGDSESGS